ncbi:uncharacterized protein LOC8050670 [Ixodes scapularis]|uniref:uncharacterized protein LOC8050670 n=1 Tax=Ixodes scapularis TaxID=6945 RepID=UPI001C3841BC|nr:uncharacterized protein LOC8050670 [Ixodes scapularis]
MGVPIKRYQERRPRVQLLLECLKVSRNTIPAGKVTFEKLTNLDFAGSAYYTIRNLSLYECQGWCRDEKDCAAAAFSFVLNPLSPQQETTCTLQNSTQARKPTARPQKAVNLYYLVKNHIRSDKVCDRLWSFERFPNQMVRGQDAAVLFTASKDSCLAACLNEDRFVCRSAEFNYVTLQCHLSDVDRRYPGVQDKFGDAIGVDYFENACLEANEVCSGMRTYDFAQVGVSQEMVTHYVDLNFYPDKELLVNSKSECLRACTVDNDFVCRSVLYKPNQDGTMQGSCSVFHVDHLMLPDGASTFVGPSPPLPLLDTGETKGIYLESRCTNGTRVYAAKPGTLKSPPSPPSETRTSTKSPVFADSPDPSCDAYGVCYDVSIQCTDAKIVVYVKTSRPFHGRIYAMGRSETCNTSVRNSQAFRLDLSLTGQDCNTQSMGGVYTNTVVLQHHNVVLTKADKVYNVRCTYETSSKNISFGMMPVSDLDFRDPDTTQITASPEAPLPKIIIFGVDGREASTVRIGDRLTFRIEIPETTPYGIFARSCIAMAKDARSTFEIIDERGCPVDPTIFPGFLQIDSSLQSSYEAFRFTESYGVIFQCNVKYCVGRCEPVVCTHGRESIDSWGRRRRAASRSQRTTQEMTLSQEILVLDIGDEPAARSMTEKPPAVNESLSYQETVELMDKCASKSSVMALSITASTLLVIYICTVAYFVAQRRVKTLP